MGRDSPSLVASGSDLFYRTLLAKVWEGGHNTPGISSLEAPPRPALPRNLAPKAISTPSPHPGHNTPGISTISTPSPHPGHNTPGISSLEAPPRPVLPRPGTSPRQPSPRPHPIQDITPWDLKFGSPAPALSCPGTSPRQPSPRPHPIQDITPRGSQV
ncbi:uncharacterized protein LOC127000108 [Eriocheir sinensis]|uniref:uncharacterized protein LOC127000108 n=1 Tax=Eriocheir sinensis TaxID=95602 RepID=UPI0021C56A6C|nr:uncharacterized protein LOC127000108 [Eriocheir sinensis]